jgi:hypothetical protein
LGVNSILRQCSHPAVCGLRDLVITPDQELVLVLPFKMMSLASLMSQV